MDIKLKYDPRKEQTEILEGFKQAVEHELPYYLIDAPTGVGKSYAAMMMANHWHDTTGSKVDVITNSKVLQSQYLKNFPFLGELKGKSNYFCSQFDVNCDEGAELAKQSKTKCLNCPHQLAFENFKRCKVSMINFHLFSSYAMFVPFILRERGAKMLVIDEAHAFEEVFTEFISLVISERVLKSVGLDDNPVVVNKLQDVQSTEDLEEFFYEFFEERVIKHVKELTRKVPDAKSTKQKSGLLRNIKSAERLLARFKKYFDDEDRDEWIFQREKAPRNKEVYIPHIKVEPTWARKYLWDLIWDKYEMVVFMSATILDPSIFSSINGLSNELMFCNVDSPFPVDNRIVHYSPVGRMSYKYKHQTIEKMIPRIKKIIEKNSDIKGILHTGNYENSYKLKEALGDNRRLIFHGSGKSEWALQHHENSSIPTILVSPAMTHGIDLKDELSRLQIIMKIPFQSLGDKRVKKRLNESQEWYIWRTWIEVIQACGRSIRNKDDWAATYILDSSFDQLLRYDQMMPDYFRDALVLPA